MKKRYIVFAGFLALGVIGNYFHQRNQLASECAQLPELVQNLDQYKRSMRGVDIDSWSFEQKEFMVTSQVRQWIEVCTAAGLYS